MTQGSQGAGSKQRLVAAAERLLRRQGYTGTGVSEIAREGAAPMGSFYHHFPGGKEQLGAAALDAGAAAYAELIAASLAIEGDLGVRLAAVATATADRLALHDFALGCPVATTALETVTSSPALQHHSRAALDLWTDLIRDEAVDAGIAPARAAELAVVAIALIEGAELMARVQRSRRPLDIAAEVLQALTVDGEEPR